MWSIIGDDIGIMNPMWHGEVSEKLCVADMELLAGRFQHQDEDQTCDDDEFNGDERPLLRVAPASQQQAAAWGLTGLTGSTMRLGLFPKREDGVDVRGTDCSPTWGRMVDPDENRINNAEGRGWVALDLS